MQWQAVEHNMKIDLYNNHEQFIKERRQDHRLAGFCHALKISKTKLETHPRIGDVRTLLDFDPYHVWMTEKDQAIWQHAWGWVYHKELALTPYLQRKLTSIIDSIEYRQRMKKAITMTSKKGRPLPDRLIGLEQ